MSNKEQTEEKIISFLKSNEKVLLLKGTHQNNKHVLVLSILYNYLANTKVLFRTNTMNNAQNFLKLKSKPKTGNAINFNGNRLYIDSINKRTWNSSPRNIEVAIVYPLDSLGYDQGGECVKDLIERNVKKVFLITWTDNKDFSWTDYYDPIHVTYDVKEEDPEYHQRVKEIESNISREEKIKGLPNYAKSTPSKYLVKIMCNKCRKTRWAKLNKPFPGITNLRNSDMGEYIATCLMCNNKAYDNYKWFR